MKRLRLLWALGSVDHREETKTARNPRLLLLTTRLSHKYKYKHKFVLKIHNAKTNVWRKCKMQIHKYMATKNVNYQRKYQLGKNRIIWFWKTFPLSLKILLLTSWGPAKEKKFCLFLVLVRMATWWSGDNSGYELRGRDSGVNGWLARGKPYITPPRTGTPSLSSTAPTKVDQVTKHIPTTSPSDQTHQQVTKVTPPLVILSHQQDLSKPNSKVRQRSYH